MTTKDKKLGGANWREVDVIADELDIDQQQSQNVVRLLDQDNTIPFIARYRKEMTKNMDVDKLRGVKALLEDLRNVQTKIASVSVTIERTGQMTRDLGQALKNAQTMSEVEHLYAPFKPGSKRSLAERARELGLETLAKDILENPYCANLEHFVNPATKGLSTFSEVEQGVQHIIADMISKDKKTMDFVRKLCVSENVKLESSKAVTKKKKEQAVDSKPKKGADASHKFEQFYNSSFPIKFIKPHQVLALNRGESLKILSVKVTIPDKVKTVFTQFCERWWTKPSTPPVFRKLIQNSIADSYTRLVQPLMCRQIRSELNKNAEKASIDVFAANLKRLLLTPPVRGKTILGIDPGFKNGCKTSVISPTGQILHTAVFYMHTGFSNVEANKLIQLVHNFRCETIAIGNGVGCRETEAYISKMIQKRSFLPLTVQYCIVSESGASIYSVSDEAKKEMPNLDPSLRGAVSISRRLQDPLAELVKIEPKHIGVGMYQHDISDNQLQKSLLSVVEECVSFVGVDLNSGSECLLRRIAGLNVAKAKKIIEWREKNGVFINREQLLEVKGLGPKSFEQCAGFVRITSTSSDLTSTSSDSPDIKPEVVILISDDEIQSSSTNTKLAGSRKRAAAPEKKASKAKKTKLAENIQANPLDQTCIHPESYTIAMRFINDVGADRDLIGHKTFINMVKKHVQFKDAATMAEHYGTGIPTMQLIVDGLKQTIDHDIREAFEKPLFKQAVRSIEDLVRGTTVTGRVTNVTHFGAFVDVGVSQDGLIHNSKMNPRNMNGKRCLELGDRVEAIISSVEIARGRIGLDLKQLL